MKAGSKREGGYPGSGKRVAVGARERVGWWDEGGLWSGKVATNGCLSTPPFLLLYRGIDDPCRVGTMETMHTSQYHPISQRRGGDGVVVACSPSLARCCCRSGTSKTG